MTQDSGKCLGAAVQGVVPSRQRGFAAFGNGASRPQSLVVQEVDVDQPARVYRQCVAVTQGAAALEVKTKDGVVAIAFHPNPGVKEALAALNGVQVMCRLTAFEGR